MYPDMFNDLVVEAKNNIIQNTTITQDQVDQMQFEDILWAVQPNESGEVNYVDVTNYLTERYPDVVNGGGFQTPSRYIYEELSSVDIYFSTSVGVKTDNL